MFRRLRVSAGKENMLNGSEDGTAYASPAVATVDGQKLVVALTAKRVIGLGLDDGKLAWEAPFAPPQGARTYNSATPIVDGQTVIVCGGNRGAKAFKLEKQGGRVTGAELWSNPDGP